MILSSGDLKRETQSGDAVQRLEQPAVLVPVLRPAHAVVGGLRPVVQDGDHRAAGRDALPGHVEVGDKGGKGPGPRHLSEGVPLAHDEKMGVGQPLPAEVVPEADVRVEQEVLPVQVRRGEGRPLRQGMGRGDGEKQPLSLEGQAVEALPRRGVGDHQLVGPPGQAVQQRLVGVFQLCGDGHLGIEPGQTGRQVPEGCRGAGAQGDGAAAPVEEAQPLLQVPALLQQRLPQLGGQDAGLVEAQAVPCPLKEGHPQVRLQLFHGLAQGGLGDVQLLRRRGQGAPPGKGRQLLQKTQFYHRGSLPSFEYLL